MSIHTIKKISWTVLLDVACFIIKKTVIEARDEGEASIRGVGTRGARGHLPNQILVELEA